MKYIKLFENFEDKIDGIISECEDILLPLSDDGIYNEIFQHRYSYGRHDHNKNKGKYLVVQIGYEVDEDYFT